MTELLRRNSPDATRERTGRWVLVHAWSAAERDRIICHQHRCKSIVRKPLDSSEFAEKVARPSIYWLATDQPPQ